MTVMWARSPFGSESIVLAPGARPSWVARYPDDALIVRRADGRMTPVHAGPAADLPTAVHSAITEPPFGEFGGKSYRYTLTSRVDGKVLRIRDHIWVDLSPEEQRWVWTEMFYRLAQYLEEYTREH